MRQTFFSGDLQSARLGHIRDDIGDLDALGVIQIKVTSQETRQAFEQFLSGLRQLRTVLEEDPKAMAADSTRA